MRPSLSEREGRIVEVIGLVDRSKLSCKHGEQLGAFDGYNDVLVGTELGLYDLNDGLKPGSSDSLKDCSLDGLADDVKDGSKDKTNYSMSLGMLEVFNDNSMLQSDEAFDVGSVDVLCDGSSKISNG